MTDVCRQWRGSTSVSPMTGESFSFMMADMTTKSLNLFLETFIVYLPPYSPELNPVEKRVFQDIKKHLKNKVFCLIEELENTVCKIVNSFIPQTLKRLTFYPYIREAF